MIREKTILISLIILNLLIFPKLELDNGFISKNKHSKMDIYLQYPNNPEMAFIKGSSYSDDSENYFKIAKKQPSIAPFKYRMLYPYLIRYTSNWWFNSADYIPILYTTIYVNFIFCLLILFITYILFKPYSKNSLLISIAIISSPGIFKTIPSLMTEIPSVLAMGLILLFWEKKFVLPILLIMSMFIKEAFVLLSIPLILQFISFKKTRLIIFSLIPPVLFISTRILFKDDPLSVNYGWALSKGDYKLKYIIQHFGTLKDSFQTIIKILYTLAPISLIYFCKKIPIYSYIKLNYHWVAFIISMLIAGLFLSSRLLRPWVILTPVIFYTVYSLKSKEIIKHTHNHH